MENRKELVQEHLTEGWVSFTRINCINGTIDRWTGDKINNPNNRTEHPMQLNAFTMYFRCNNGKWVNRCEIIENPYEYLTKEYCELFNAEDIFKMILR